MKFRQFQKHFRSDVICIVAVAHNAVGGGAEFSEIRMIDTGKGAAVPALYTQHDLDKLRPRHFPVLLLCDPVDCIITFPALLCKKNGYFCQFRDLVRINNKKKYKKVPKTPYFYNNMSLFGVFLRQI